MQKFQWDGVRLKHLIKERGFTQETLANAMTQFINEHGLDQPPTNLAEVKQQYITRWQTNKFAPTNGYIAVLAVILQTKTDYLLGVSKYADDYSGEDLTETEKALVTAKRNGDFKEIMRLLTDV